MSTYKPNTKRIAKNTFFLYFRQIFSIIVNVVTVRIVLKVLGAEDYGIYNVISGIVVAIGFVKDSMANATQRYYAIEIGERDEKSLSNLYSMILIIYIVLCLLIFLFGETLGLYYIRNQLQYPENRSTAVFWCYQCAIASFLLSFLSMPSYSLILAYEDMQVSAYITIFESVCKLLLAFGITYINYDKLIVYSVFMTLPIVGSFLFYIAYSKFHYRNVRYSFYWNKSLFKEMSVYTISNLGGSFISILKIQLLNVIINQRFNAIVVSARGIATNVSNIIQSFSLNFSTAMSPVIIKSYASVEKDKLQDIVYRSCKISFYISFLISLPAMLEMNYIMNIWLGKPPQDCSTFAALILFDAIVESVTIPLISLIQATGKITKYVTTVVISNVLYVPVCILLFYLGFGAISALVVSPFFTCILDVVRILYSVNTVEDTAWQYFKKVIIPLIVVASLSSILPIILIIFLEESIIRLFVTTGISIVNTSLIMYCFGLNEREKTFARNILRKRLKL